MLKLCTLVETRVVKKALPSEIKKLSVADLQNIIKRMRKLRDKQRDLYKRQILKARQPGNTSGAKGLGLNARTKEKAVFFDNVLGIFKERLLLLRRKTKTAKPKTAIGKKKSKPLVQDRRAPKAANKKTEVAKEKTILAINPSSKHNPSATRKNAPPKGVAAGGYISQGAQASAQRSQLQQSRSRPIQGHISSAGKRAQAKRDSR